jgi:hypothetical protein
MLYLKVLYEIILDSIIDILSTLCYYMFVTITS